MKNPIQSTSNFKAFENTNNNNEPLEMTETKVNFLDVYSFAIFVISVSFFFDSII